MSLDTYTDAQLEEELELREKNRLQALAGQNWKPSITEFIRLLNCVESGKLNCDYDTGFSKWDFYKLSKTTWLAIDKEGYALINSIRVDYRSHVYDRSYVRREDAAATLEFFCKENV